MADRSGELRRYARRVADRWPLEHAFVTGPPWVVVLVAPAFDGVPWLERVRQAGALWDAAEMDGPADVHCYTPVELERKMAQLEIVRAAVQGGDDVLAAD